MKTIVGLVWRTSIKSTTTRPSSRVVGPPPLEPDDADSWHCLALAAAKSDEVGESWNAVKELRKLDPDYTLDPLLLELFPTEKK